MAFPQPPRDPFCIVGDTSAVIQVLFCDDAAPFRVLLQRFGIRCGVVSAAEHELHNLTKARFPGLAGSLKKCLSTGSISVLNREALREAMGSTGNGLMDTIDSLGSDYYHLGVDRGEAYSHAAAGVLGVPILTHDTRAVRVLRDNGVENYGRPVLRAFDLVVLGLQCGEIEMARCEELLKNLKSFGERLPNCFENRSFEDGLARFYPRILDRACRVIGAAQPVQIPWDSERIWVGGESVRQSGR